MALPCLELSIYYLTESSLWNRVPSVDQASSELHSIEDYTQEESLHSEDKSVYQIDSETEPRDRYRYPSDIPIISAGPNVEKLQM